MRCRRCGRKVRCEVHGDRYIVEDFVFDCESFPFYYCERCVEEFKTALGSVVHDHSEECIETMWSLFCEEMGWREAEEEGS